MAGFNRPSTASALDVVDVLATLDVELAAAADVDVLVLVLLLLHAAATSGTNTTTTMHDLRRPLICYLPNRIRTT